LDFLIDTSVVVRAVHRQDPASRTARGAIRKLAAAHHQLYILPQNTAEFWAVCTRPIEKNGLGYEAARVGRYIARFESVFTILFEAERGYREWKRLVTAHAITGTEVHDTRIVAAMIAHGIVNILTFNVKDFQRYGGINVMHPAKV
jgi:predicted nucleic acid-binding protein